MKTRMGLGAAVLSIVSFIIPSQTYAKSNFFSNFGVENTVDLGKTGISLKTGTGISNLSDIGSGVEAKYGKDNVNAKFNMSQFKALKKKKKK